MIKMYKCSDGFECASEKLRDQRERRLQSINPLTNKPYTEYEEKKAIQEEMKRKLKEARNSQFGSD